MKRVLIALVTALPLAVGGAGAQAATPAFTGLPGVEGTGTPRVAVAGTVVSVNAAAGSFLANAYVLTPPTGGSDEGPASGLRLRTFGDFGGHARANDLAAPTTTQVTITASASTTIHIAGVQGPALVSNLVAGARFLALFPGAPTDAIQTLVANSATSIFAQLPKQLYAFVGTVTGTDTTAGTVTVDVTRSLPSSLIADGTPATFTVSSHTFILGGSSLSASGFGGLFGGSLSGVSTGDMVAGGLIGAPGLTVTQVNLMPLMFLLDLPAPGSGSNASAADRALKETVKLLHGGKVRLGKSHGKKTRRHAKSKHAGRR
jgi:hypothetical protein